MFDWGGVIQNTPKPGEVPMRAAELFGVDRDTFMEAYYDEYKAVRTGQISHDQLWPKLGERLYKPVPDELQNELDKLTGAYNLKVIEVIQLIKSKHIRVCILSNVGEASGIRNSAYIGVFDAVYLSVEQGLTKPDDVAFYELGPQEFKVCYEETLMVDDLDRNLELPRRLGMQTFLAANEDQIVTNLVELLNR